MSYTVQIRRNDNSHADWGAATLPMARRKIEEEAARMGAEFREAIASANAHLGMKVSFTRSGGWSDGHPRLLPSRMRMCEAG